MNRAICVRFDRFVHNSAVSNGDTQPQIGEDMEKQEPKSGRDMLYRVAATYLESQLRDQRTRRIRNWLLAGAVISYVAVNIGILFINTERPKTEKYAAVVRVDGTIGVGKMASMQVMGKVLKKAFDDNGAQCVAVVINSGGGAVGQSQMIYDTIKALQKEKHRKVIAVGEDMMASGAYMIAMSAEKVYANPASIVGSIGVIIPGMEYKGLGDKYGVKDRTHASGSMKDAMNPLKEETPEQTAHIDEVIGELFHQFVDIVKGSRGDRLKPNGIDLFNGQFWTGQRAAQLGIIDGLLSVDDAVKQDCGADSYVTYQPELGMADILSLIPGR